MPMEKKKRPSTRPGEHHRSKTKGSDNESSPSRPKKDNNRQGTKSAVQRKKR